MKISLGTDHAGFLIKNKVINFLQSLGHEVVDYGTNSAESCDYPDFAYKVALDVSSNKSQKGVLICGTGIGMAISANKVPNIRAGVCWSKETAQLISLHNDANIICVGARFASFEDICDWIKIFLETKFEERHSKRINKIIQIEKDFCTNNK
ncbi:MAG: ribose 5-phosphate isomerase B [Endomicrobiaceae bacterium]|jgi:ribose 5-phosphate isomerase B|nr:ribose 5-phosphate isomerase B [Endomicrobiaceae bacterium]MDD3053180.1 ribose 5-phosphate isomerase B [Endomicrobiaceae bacterium]MDD3922047.1 ribose 5-phosphate isomerase B [Endomicrobiaceae bacterium]MDD5101490.1 ribose 5-phosphate isomerase B [Endomicrobiaceae bacterium]